MAVPPESTSLWWASVKEHFLELRTADQKQRDSRLEELRARDAEMYAAVTELLSHDRQSRDSLDVAVARALEHANQGRPGSIGKYETVRVLGSGASGVVYLAKQVNPQRHVALKVLHPHRWTEEGARRLAREADALARVSHPSIAQIYEVNVGCGSGNAPGSVGYIAMEFVPGIPLQEYFAVRNATIVDRIQLVCQICDAVEHAHQRGVLHRDLKPDNIRVLPTPVPAVKLLDFGVAALVSSEGVASSTIHVAGTPAYMSPEQASCGASEVQDTRSDVYSLGVILYEGLSGHLPIQLVGHSPLSWLDQVRTSFPRPLSDGHPQLRGDIEVVVMKAIAREPGNRYQSAGEFAADLRRFLRREPIAARPASSAYLLWMLGRRHRTLAFTAMSLFVLVIACIGFVAMYAAQSRRDADSAQASLTSLVEHTVKRIEGFPGTVESRREALRDADRIARPIVSQHPEDDSLQQLWSRVLLAESSLSIDDREYDAALRLRMEALSICSIQASKHRTDIKCARAFSEAQVLVGDACGLSGADAVRREWYRCALESQIAAAKHAPDDIGLVDDLCWSYDRLGDAAYRAGDAIESVRNFSLQLDCATRLQTLAGTTSRTLFALTEAHRKLATAHADMGNWSQSELHVLAAMDLIQPETTLSFPAKSSLAAFENLLLLRAGIDSHLDRKDAAIRHLGAVVQLARKWADFSPDDVDLDEQCLHVEVQAARIANRIGDGRMALQTLESSSDRIPRLARKRGQTASLRQDWYLVYMERACAAMLLGYSFDASWEAHLACERGWRPCETKDAGSETLGMMALCIFLMEQDTRARDSAVFLRSVAECMENGCLPNAQDRFTVLEMLEPLSRPATKLGE